MLAKQITFSGDFEMNVVKNTNSYLVRWNDGTDVLQEIECPDLQTANGVKLALSLLYFRDERDETSQNYQVAVDAVSKSSAKKTNFHAKMVNRFAEVQNKERRGW
jgi:hypothetical protein